MSNKKKSRWNLWYSKQENNSWFYKKDDKREKLLPVDSIIVKFYYSDSYNKVWPKCYDWIEQNLNYWIEENLNKTPNNSLQPTRNARG